MQVIITINLGNYENIKLISSEWETYEACKEELIKALLNIDHEAAERMIVTLQRNPGARYK